jgi:hypothetical protein
MCEIVKKTQTTIGNTMNKNTVLALGLLSLATSGLTAAQASVKLILDQSAPLGMVGNTNYDLDNNLIEITLDRPVLCNQAPGYNVGSLTKLKIYDPNLEMKGGFGINDGLYFSADADYVVNDGQLFLDTDNPAKALCVSAEMGDYDLIFKSAFETTNQNSAYVRYVNLPSIVSPGQVINYQIEFGNPSAQPIYFDLLEYWDHNSGQHSGYIAANNQRICNNTDPDVVCSVGQYDDSGVIKGIQLGSGGTFVLDVTQTVHQNSTAGSELDFMAGVFLTNGQNGDFLPKTLSGPHFLNNPITVSKTVSVQNNNPPQLSWDVAPPALTSFYEDESNTYTYKVRYNDAQTSAGNLAVSVTHQYGSNNKVNVVKGPFVLDGFDGTMTLDVSPIANAFTDSPEEVTVTVTDGGGLTSSLTFDVEVTPVNDAPTFAMNCAELTINEQNGNMNCTSPIVNGVGNQIQNIYDDEFIIADFNAGPNESHQSVDEYEVQWLTNQGQDDPNGILQTYGDGSPGIIINNVSGEITVLANNGVTGTAQVQIRVKDNGGVAGANGCDVNDPGYVASDGCNVSDWQSLTIVSEGFKYTVGGTISGVPAGSVFSLKLTGVEDGQAVVENIGITTVSSPEAYIFNQLLDDQSNYQVTFNSVPFGYSCTINGGQPPASGTINGVNVVNVDIDCVAD